MSVGGSVARGLHPPPPQNQEYDHIPVSRGCMQVLYPLLMAKTKKGTQTAVREPMN